jgi:serine/threonine-protein kinase RsbW
MPSTVRIEIDSRVENVARVQRILGEVLTEHGVAESARDAVGLAVGEAVVNAIVHGNGSRPELPVVVGLTVDRNELIVTVEDEGDGFDPAAVADPRDPARQLEPHGRGVLLMSSIMDDVRCVARPRGGSRVTLRASLASQPHVQR